LEADDRFVVTGYINWWSFCTWKNGH